MVRTRVKLAATLTVVVLALTGFHSGKGHGSSSGGSGSGKSKSKSRSHSDDDDDDSGGCSSSEKDNDDYGSQSGPSSSPSSSSPSPTATAEVEVVVVDCVKPARKKSKGRPARKADTTATLEITSRAASEGTYRVTLRFEGAAGSAVGSAEAVVTVGGGEKKTFEVAMKDPKAVDRVKNCRIGEVGAR